MVTTLLDLAEGYARHASGCCKTAVGSAIVDNYLEPKLAVFGANITMPENCKHAGCLRIQKHGSNSKQHRNPEDCRALHSEIAALCNAAKLGISVKGMTIIVTRYPCEACARAIIHSGISEVVYGREFPISEQTDRMFAAAGVKVTHLKTWTTEETNDTNY